MASYSEFSIQGIVPDISQKTIVVKTNFKVDPNSVTESTVMYYCYDTGSLEKYQLRIDNKNIYIDFENYPDDNSRYYLKISGIKDALGRVLKTNYDGYIKFEKDIKTKVKILAPTSRVTLKSRLIDIRLQAIEPIANLTYRIEISSDNIFYNKLATLLCTVPNEFYNSENEQMAFIPEDFSVGENSAAKVNEGYYYNNEIQLSVTVEREGQIYLRARAELDEGTAGDWAEFICFNIHTISMDSIETTFLEDYLTSDDMFDDSIMEYEETEIKDRSQADVNEGYFYLELNKDILIPEDYELDENGYINLGTIIGFRKELK